MMRAGASLTENRFFNNCGGKLFAKTGPILLDSNTFAIHRTNVFELSDQLCHSYLSSLPLRGVLEPKGAVEALDLLHTFTAQSFQ